MFSFARLICDRRSLISDSFCVAAAFAVLLFVIRASVSARVVSVMSCIAPSTVSRASSVENMMFGWIGASGAARTGAANTLNAFERIIRSFFTFASSFCHMSTTRHAADLPFFTIPAR